MEKNLNQSVYIPSLEASDLYSNQVRGTELKFNYLGMIPYSLELIKLEQVGMEIKSVGKEDKPKRISRDIINVKFDKKLKAPKQMVKELQAKINKSDDEEYKNKLNNYIELINEESEKNPTQWKEVNVSELRRKVYTEGIKLVDKDGVVTDYVVYKRSSAKSRTGQVLIIKKELHDVMISWSRMGMDIKEGIAVDFPSLLAYESLVGSSIESTITIKPENIFMIEDVESSFQHIANVVKTNEETKLLHSVEEEVTINNSIWDGQSLLDSDYFTNGKGMMLLRNHFFKSCAFNTNIKKFLEDHKPEGISLDEWMLEDMFGNPVRASAIHLITTPSSLKALKFSPFVGTDEDMWNHWSEIVAADKNKFGIVKSEKSTKHTYNKNLEHDENGQLYRETSYQMLNSLPCNKEDIYEMSEFERTYIEKLKNDSDFFIQHIEKSVSSQNANQMFVDLYKINKDIVSTKPFKDYRKRIIHDHVKYVKKGKIRLMGDYATMVGNPILMLKKVINTLDENNLVAELGENEVYTTLFDFEDELTGFRSPHTSQSNVLVVKNVFNQDLKDYFNFSKNIVVVNSVKTPLLDRLSGSDFDSDVLLLLKNNHLLKRSKECKDYKVVVNGLKGDKTKYKLIKEDMYKIDNILSSSTETIGLVTNTAQLLLSLYWDTKNEQLMEKVFVLTCLSGVSIDLAKKLYDIDIQKEIEHIESQFELKKEDGVFKKPLFWVNVSQNKKTKNKVMSYECPMDYLHEIMSDLEDAGPIPTSKFSDLLVHHDYSKADRKQIKKITEYVKNMQGKIVEIYMKNVGDSDKVVEERNRQLDKTTNDTVSKVGKLKIKPTTMYDMLRKIDGEDKKKDDKKNITIRLMNTMFKTHNETFIAAFKNSPK
jgi:hypothetical protein